MNEVRLIDANALKYKNLAEVNGRLTYVLTAEEIFNAPTVDLWQMRQEATENALKKAEVLYGRPQGEWKSLGFVHSRGYAWCTCSNCGKTTKIYLDKDNDFCCIADIRNKAVACLFCGADMHKPNCVTCDHFGKCEGCEKGEEE